MNSLTAGECMSSIILYPSEGITTFPSANGVSILHLLRDLFTGVLSVGTESFLSIAEQLCCGSLFVVNCAVSSTPSSANTGGVSNQSRLFPPEELRFLLT